jgi:hypothetical protein
MTAERVASKGGKIRIEKDSGRIQVEELVRQDGDRRQCQVRSYRCHDHGREDAALVRAMAGYVRWLL